MPCNNDQSGIELGFGFGSEEDCRRALARTGHSIVLHCFGSACLIRHEVDQFGYLEE